MCNGVFHAESACLGVAQEGIDCLLSSGWDALSYLCSSCRTLNCDNASSLGQPTTSLHNLYRQLNVTVGELDVQLRSVMGQLKIC